MTTRKRSTKAAQPKATDAKATQEAQEAEAKAAQEAQEAEAKAAQDAQEPDPSAETRPDDSDLGEQIDGQGLEPIQGEVPTGGDIPALFIRTKRKYKSRRRAGFRFSREGYGIALSALTEDQVKALVGDPALEVESCTFPASAEETEEPAS